MRSSYITVRNTQFARDTSHSYVKHIEHADACNQSSKDDLLVDDQASSCYEDTPDLDCYTSLNDLNEFPRQEPINFEPLHPKGNKFRVYDTIAPRRSIMMSTTCPHCCSDVYIESPDSQEDEEEDTSIITALTSPSHSPHAKTRVRVPSMDNNLGIQVPFEPAKFSDDIFEASSVKSSSSSDWSVDLTDDNSPITPTSGKSASKSIDSSFEFDSRQCLTSRFASNEDVDTLRKQIVPTIRVNRYSTTVHKLPELKTMASSESLHMGFNTKPRPAKTEAVPQPIPKVSTATHTTTSPFVRTRYYGPTDATIGKKPMYKQSWKYIIPELRDLGLVHKDRGACGYRVMSTAITTQQPRPRHNLNLNQGLSLSNNRLTNPNALTHY